jgi:hypothetical protein
MWDTTGSLAIGIDIAADVGSNTLRLKRLASDRWMAHEIAAS